MFKIMSYKHTANIYHRKTLQGAKSAGGSFDAKPVSVHFTLEEARIALQSQPNGCMFIQ